jgi:hypothetical protein
MDNSTAIGEWLSKRPATAEGLRKIHKSHALQELQEIRDLHLYSMFEIDDTTGIITANPPCSSERVTVGHWEVGRFTIIDPQEATS